MFIAKETFKLSDLNYFKFILTDRLRGIRDVVDVAVL